MTAPTSDLTAEQAVLGAMLLDNTTMADLSSMLRPGDFYNPNHGTLFTIMIDMFGKGLPVDETTLLSRLIETGDVVRVGGAPYIASLTRYANPMSGTHYARQVADRATDRAIGQLAIQAEQLATSPGETATKVAMIRQLADDLGAHREAVPSVSVADAMEDAIIAIENARDGIGTPVIPTPFAELNRMLGGGFRPGQSIIVGARPGIGKSTFVLDCLRHAAARDIPSQLVSLEMPIKEIMERFLSAETGIPLAMIRTGQLRPDEEQRITNRVTTLAARPLRLLDKPGASLPYIRGETRRGVARHGLRLVGIDYIGLIPSPPGSESRQHAVAEMSRAIKLMVMELGITSITASQLNRQPEQRRDKTPGMADLRESGQVEQDADIVILLHDPTLGNPEHPRAGEFDFIVAKHRGGATGTVTVTSRLHVAQFADMATV